MNQIKIRDLPNLKPCTIIIDTYPIGMRYPLKISGVVSNTVVGLYRGKDVSFPLQEVMKLERIGETIQQISEDGLKDLLTEGRIFLVCELQAINTGVRGINTPLQLVAVALTLDTHIFN